MIPSKLAPTALDIVGIFIGEREVGASCSYAATAVAKLIGGTDN
jgi:hypothetical protein